MLLASKHPVIMSLCTVLLLAAVSCVKDKTTETPSEENGFNLGFGYVGGYSSCNVEFERDWASQTEITLILDYYKENGQPVVKSLDVPLPWAWQKAPQQWLPRFTARNMAELDPTDWELVFNLTGVDMKPGEHYFGLYNRFTGILRVFYYLTEDRLPAHDANDHMWSMGLSKDLIEHVTFQYAIPYGEEATEAYKAAMGGNDAVFKTTALTAECTNEGKVVPKVGWWAYDIDMSAMRPHDFFSSDRSVMRPGVEVFNQDNVVLSSIMHGSLDGSISGNMNMNSLKGSGTTNGGLIGGIVGGFLNSTLTNKAILDMMFDPKAIGDAGLTSFLGIMLGTVGKGMEAKMKTGREDPDKLGDFNGKINLTLDATIETVGSIGGERTTLVPSPELNVASFINPVQGFGGGVWNIEHHPVVYVVTDAFWGDKAKFSSVEKVTSEGRTAYQLTMNPDDVGLRLISFLDPTSIGTIYVNRDALPKGVIGDINVSTSYGVLKGATPGYTDGFRNAIGLSYEEPELTSMSSYQSDDPAVGFRIIKKPHADELFLSAIPEAQKSIIGHRLSQQQVGENIHRRMFGASAMYCNPNAGTNELDDVSLVSDPEVFLPVNSSDRLLFGMEIPDFVVTAMMSLNAADDVIMTHSLRFIPRIEFVKLEDLPQLAAKIYVNGIAVRNQKGITFPHLDEDIQKISDLSRNATK